jgi:hypothetical protein
VTIREQEKLMIPLFSKHRIQVNTVRWDFHLHPGPALSRKEHWRV